MRTRLLALVCSLVCSLVLLPLTFSIPSRAQQDATANSQNNDTIEGTVVSSSRDTLVVRGENGEYHLFTSDPGTRPAGLTRGARVRVTAGGPDENGARTATNIVMLGTASSDQAKSASNSTTRDKGAQAAPVPEKVSGIEDDIRREARRWRLGVRTGVGFNPELFMFGVHSQMGPIFNRHVQFRPNAEFDFGEVTDLIAVNLEGVYRFSEKHREGNWLPYVGAGPALIFIHQNFQVGRQIDFGNFDYETGFNILVGMQSRRGAFVELKSSLYSGPAPRLRLIVGYTF